VYSRTLSAGWPTDFEDFDVVSLKIAMFRGELPCLIGLRGRECISQLEARCRDPARHHCLRSSAPCGLCFILFFQLILYMQHVPHQHRGAPCNYRLVLASSSSWSRYAIFTLIGVSIAVAGNLIMLLIASPKPREWLSYPHRCPYMFLSTIQT
jgi:hypothetical protein